MTDGICQFFAGRLRPPRKAPQLIDDTHESTHQRSSAPFWKAKNYAAQISTLDSAVTSSEAETSLTSLPSQDRFCGCAGPARTMHVAHPIRSITPLLASR